MVLEYYIRSDNQLLKQLKLTKMFFVELKINFNTGEEAKAFFKSIEPELNDFSRSETKITQKSSLLTVSINASDRAAMRASYNSIIKPLILFNKLEEIK